MPVKATQDYLKDLDVVELLVPITFTRGLAGKSVGAHYCYDPRAFDGIVIPTSRRVVKRTPDGPVLSEPVVPSRLHPRSAPTSSCKRFFASYLNLRPITWIGKQHEPRSPFSDHDHEITQVSQFHSGSMPERYALSLQSLFQGRKTSPEWLP